MNKKYNPFQPIIDKVKDRPYNISDKFLLNNTLHNCINRDFVLGIRNHEIYKLKD